MNPKVTICICTLDRHKSLPDALNSLSSSPDIKDCEVLVINNGPTNLTEEVCAAYAPKLNIRYFTVSERSLGAARNKGWHESASSSVAYLDDDAYVGPTWLSAAIEFSCDSKLAGQTGRVKPDPCLDVLTQTFHPAVCNAAFSLLDYGEASRDLHIGESPIGNNMIFKKTILAEGGGFAQDLRTYDEAFLTWPAMWRGMRFRYDPRMEAFHKIPDSRQCKEWVREKTAASGISYQILLSRLKSFPQCPKSFDILHRGLRALCGWLIATASRRRKQQFAFECEIIFNLNRIRYVFNPKGLKDYD